MLTSEAARGLNMCSVQHGAAPRWVFSPVVIQISHQDPKTTKPNKAPQ